MTIVMGLDQHRAQITAEWIDTATGEVSRGRVTPAHREGVRRFVEPFRGMELEVAFEATTGWRFVVEELRRMARGCIWPSRRRRALAGNKKRAKTDRADARHLRELLMIGRLPESWIPPEHILDLRARVRLASHARRTIAASGSSGSRRCSITTGAPTALVCCSATGAPGLTLPLPDRARAGHRRVRDDRRARPCSWRRLTGSCARTLAASQAARR